MLCAAKKKSAPNGQAQRRAAVWSVRCSALSGALQYIEDIAVTVFRTPKDFDLFYGLGREIPDGRIGMIAQRFCARFKHVVISFNPGVLGKRVSRQHLISRAFGGYRVLADGSHVRIGGLKEFPDGIRSLLAQP